MKQLLFSRELLELHRKGLKPVTRRLERGLTEINKAPGKWSVVPAIMGDGFDFYVTTNWSALLRVKPHYLKGEIVYVPEPYRILDVDPQEGEHLPTQVEYRDGDKPWIYRPLSVDKVRCDKWFSPRIMPAWAARLFDRIVDARPERLTLPLSPEELALEGGEAALKYLEPYNGLWLFRYLVEPVTLPHQEEG